MTTTPPRGHAELTALFPALLDALAQASTGVVLVGDEGTQLDRWYANEPAASLLGYTIDELYDVPIIETIVPDQRALLGHLIDGFRAGAPLPPVLELELLHKNGDHVPAEMAVGRIDLTHATAYAVLIRGIAGRAKLQMSLLEADRIGLVGALAAGVAHEINNPLTSVLLNLRSLRKLLATHLPEAYQAAAVRVLDDLTTGAERIASQTRALQTLASPSDRQDIDMAAVVSSALRLAAPTLQPRANVIHQIFPVPAVAGEPSRLGQAVLSMLLFAGSGFADVGHEGERDLSRAASNRIIVCVEERDGCVAVDVTDNGHALTAEEASRAFDPFFRSPARGAGLGVGLGVARSVATTLGGSVALVPRTGGGAIITMTLPTRSA